MSEVASAPVAAPVVSEATPGEDSGSIVSDAAKEVMRKYQVKVDGQDMEVDENELKRGYTHQRAANKILQEGKQARKQAEQFIEMMKDPEQFWKAAEKLGHNKRDQVEKYLASQLEEEMMDPRDKELKDAKAKLKYIDDMENKQKEQIEKQRNEALKAKYAEDYSKQFVSALEETGLPATKPMVAEMAKYIARSTQIGFKMTAIEAAKLVKEDIQLAHQKLLGNTDGETLIKLLGEDVANKVRKWDTSRVKDPNAQMRTPVEQKPRERSSNNKRMSSNEWRDFNRR